MKFRFLLVFLVMIMTKNTVLANENVNLFDFSFEDIDGNQIDLKKFEGKPLIIKNFKMWVTPQYKDLQNLFVNYKDSDLMVKPTSNL